jgi:hypothetical protein
MAAGHREPSAGHQHAVLRGRGTAWCAITGPPRAEPQASKPALLANNAHPAIQLNANMCNSAQPCAIETLFAQICTELHVTTLNGAGNLGTGLSGAAG